MDGRTDGVTANTSGLCKMRIKAMHRCAEESQYTFGDVDIADFATVICEEQQRLLARTGCMSGQAERITAVKEKLNTFNGKRESWSKANRELTAHLNQIKNEVGIPIYYIIQDPEQVQGR
jgi:hypothetical protein